MYKITDEAREALLSEPLRQNISSTGEINGALYNADFLGPDAFTKVDTRMKVASQSMNLVAKLDVNTNETTSLTFGGTAAGGRYNAFSYANSLMNWDNNNQVTNFDWRAYAKFSQRFINDEDDTSTLKNVFYQIMADYSQTYSNVQDASHQDNFFRYGHVGRFDVYNRNSYAYNDINGRFQHNGWEDTL